MKALLIISVLFLAGCKPNGSYEDQFTNFTCTPEQWEKTTKEAKESIAISISGETDKRFSVWYLGAAIERNCERKKP